MLAEGGLTVEFYWMEDKTPARLPLVNIYRNDGRRSGKPCSRKDPPRGGRRGTAMTGVSDSVDHLEQTCF